jgi:peptide/nickel transport system substrate-binding protein
MSRTGKLVSSVMLSVLAVWAPFDARSAPAAAQRLVVAGSPPIHEAVFPHQGSISQKFPTRVMFEYLTEVDPTTWDYDRPMLAERWQMSPDARTWTFSLRKGVQFHDGFGEMTAEDVKFSLELLMSKDAIATTSPTWRKNVDKLEAVDRHTFRLVLKSPDPDVLFELSSAREVQIVSKKQIETMGVDKASQRPAGTGPYRLVEWRRGELVRFAAVDKHWRVVPQFKELVCRFVADDAARVAMLRSGDADIIELPRSLKKDVESAGFEARRALWPGVVVFGVMGGQYLKDRPTYNPRVPWVDPRVREAINLAINRKAMIEHLFLGGAQATTVPVIPSWVKELNNPAWKPYPYDVDRARKLLAEAGHPSGFTVEWRAYPMPGTPELIAVSEALQADLAKVGVKLDLKVTEFQNHRSDMRDRKVAGIGFLHRTGIPPDPVTQLALFYTAGGIQGAVELAEIEDLFVRLAKTSDPRERARIIRSVGDVVYNGYHVIPLVDIYPLFGVNPKKVGTWKTTGYYNVTHLEYAQKPRP